MTANKKGVRGVWQARRFYPCHNSLSEFGIDGLTGDRPRRCLVQGFQFHDEGSAKRQKASKETQMGGRRQQTFAGEGGGQECPNSEGEGLGAAAELTSSLSEELLLSMYMVNMQWERLERLFIWCWAMARDVSPSNRALNASASLAITRHSAPFRLTPPWVGANRYSGATEARAQLGRRRGGMPETCLWILHDRNWRRVVAGAQEVVEALVVDLHVGHPDGSEGAVVLPQAVEHLRHSELKQRDWGAE